MTAGRSDAWRPLLAAVVYGASVPLAKEWLRGVPRLLASGWIYLTMGLGLGAFLLVARRPPDERLRRSDVATLAWATGLGSVLAPYALLEGIDRLPGNVASLLLTLEIVVAAVLAVVWFGERLEARAWGALLLIVVGTGGTAYLAESGGEAAGALVGVAWIVAACLFWSLDSNLTRRLAHRDPVRITCWKGLVGGTVAVGLATALGDRPPDDVRPWLAGAAIGVLPYGLSIVLFVAGMRTLGAARATALFGTHPFVGVVASAFVLGEPLTLGIVALAAVLGLGVWLLVRSTPRSP